MPTNAAKKGLAGALGRGSGAFLEHGPQTAYVPVPRHVTPPVMLLFPEGKPRKAVAREPSQRAVKPV
jgi:hypothetical protein